jgi:aminopeptidase-like protein
MKKNILITTEGKLMLKWAKTLFPICRSLTGKGTQTTLRFFKKINNEFKLIKFKSGTKVFDWKIPLEWNIRNAYIQHTNKKKFAEFKKNNLHVVGYSTPVNKIISKKELIKNIYTQKNQPNAIPYVTSYYKKRWGFCMTDNMKKKLPDGKYKVLIDSDLKKGFLELMEAKLRGNSKKEIFFSSYVCHPSMANNELSGPVLLNAILKYVKEKYPKRKFGYRFVLLPETIGPIAYLSRFKSQLKKNVICGFNLTCVGDERAYTMIETPNGNTLADRALISSLKNKKNFKKYSFLDRASDERQYCSPLINLPVCCFSKSKNYPEYHTNLDNFNVVTEKGLQQSFNVFKDIIDAFETDLYPKTKINCEPNLGSRNLYPTLSQKGIYDNEIKNRMNLIAYASGQNDIFKISNLLNQSLDKTCKELKILKSKNILI